MYMEMGLKLPDALIDKVVEDNPELPIQFIKDTLLAVAEMNAGQISEYRTT
jgi:hypothetical protein